jgi:hypothetical protein
MKSEAKVTAIKAKATIPKTRVERPISGFGVFDMVPLPDKRYW